MSGTLPGMPHASSGTPLPTARLPLSWPHAAAWLIALSLLGAATAHLLIRRRGGQVAVLTMTTVLVWCLWTDTDPWLALGHRWPASVAAGLVALGLALWWAARPQTAPIVYRAWAPAVMVVGLTVVLPALTVWDAFTAAGHTDSWPGRVAVSLVAASTAALLSLPAWWASHGHPGAAGLVGAALAALITLMTGSVVAALVLGGTGVTIFALTTPRKHRQTTQH